MKPATQRREREIARFLRVKGFTNIQGTRGNRNPDFIGYEPGRGVWAFINYFKRAPSKPLESFNGLPNGLPALSKYIVYNEGENLVLLCV